MREPVLPFAIVEKAVKAALLDRDWADETLHKVMSERFGQKPDTFFRVWARARQRGWIGLHAADRFLVILGMTFYDLDGYDLDYEPPLSVRVPGRKLHPSIVEMGMEMLRNGVHFTEVAKALDVDARSVQRWRTKVTA